MIENIVNRLNDKHILILGFGREGKSTLRFVQKFVSYASVAVADRNDAALQPVRELGLPCFGGDDYLNAVNNFDIVIKTPGISLLGMQISQNVYVTSQTDLFLSAFHSQTIGISGTKGKSTTTSLIYHLLKSSGRKAILTGNIGIPCFDVVEHVDNLSVVVYELSAHQLEYVHQSPRVGVLLNIFEEHLDHFGTFERYKQAKLNLLRYMGDDDYAVVHDSLLDETLQLGVNSVVYSNLDFDGDVDWSALPLFGEHNMMNVRAALVACSKYGVDYRELVPYLYDFQPLEHRLERVGEYGGVTFVNDSISTIPQAAISACKALGRVDFLLLGGFDRGIDYAPLVSFLKDNRVSHLLFTGKAGLRMMQLLQEAHVDTKMVVYGDMDEAFAYIGANACEGDVCLLSPAASSYDRYKNFEERGSVFKKLAKCYQSAK